MRREGGKRGVGKRGKKRESRMAVTDGRKPGLCNRTHQDKSFRPDYSWMGSQGYIVTREE